MSHYQQPNFKATTPPMYPGRRRNASQTQRNDRIIHEVRATLEQEVEPEHWLWIKLIKSIDALKTFYTIIETICFVAFIVFSLNVQLKRYLNER